jgi:uncharacterized membrane protein YbhN (UPF0104 family)
MSFAIGILILAVAFSRGQIDVGASLRIIVAANWQLAVAALLVYYLTFPIRGLRWRGMLENAGCRRSDLPGVLGLAEIIYLSWFANCVVPAKLGDVYRAYLLRERSSVTFSKAGGTILAERLIDLVVLLVALGVSGLLSFQGKLPSSIVIVLELGSGAVVVAGLGLILLRRLDHLVRRLVPLRFQRIYAHFHEGTLGSFGGYPRLLGLTVLAWTAESSRLFLVTRALGVSLSTSFALSAVMVVFIAMAAAFLTAPPGTPGGLGYVEAAMALALTLLGLGQTAALSVALLDRAISFGSVIVGGFVVYMLSQRHA